MSVRTYNPSVRVGNWNEDIQLEEDSLKDFLEKRERGELLIQKSASLRSTNSQKVNLSIARDGKVHFGDLVMLQNPAPKDGSRGDHALSVNFDMNGPSGVTGSNNIQPCARSTFVITSNDGSPAGSTLKYGQAFYLCTTDGSLYLHSDRATFQNCAKKSRHNPISLVPEPSHLTEWMVVAFDPQFRPELEHSNVPANERVIIRHCKTNENICLESDHSVRTYFGMEHEISTFANLDSHKAEKDVNHWMIVMNVPGDPAMPVPADQ